MEIFKIRKSNVFISDIENKFVHVDYYPDNFGIQNEIMLGAEICFNNKTIEQALNEYEEIARAELFQHINQKYVNMFIL